jgi:hypothetical protein
MTPRDWMTLALRVMGVWFVIRAFVAIVNLIIPFMYVFSIFVRVRGNLSKEMLYPLGPPLLEILTNAAVAAVLLFFAVKITDYLYREQPLMVQ